MSVVNYMVQIAIASWLLLQYGHNNNAPNSRMKNGVRLVLQVASGSSSSCTSSYFRNKVFCLLDSRYSRSVYCVLLASRLVPAPSRVYRNTRYLGAGDVDILDIRHSFA